jgi:RNA polymerase sigma-70 factor (ECF subfamily)
VVSLTFLEAWRLRETVAPDGGSLRPWLLGIAVNVTRNQARAARRHRAAMSRLSRPADLPDFAEELIYRVEQGQGPSADQEAFVTIGDLLRDKIAPPKVSAALYRRRPSSRG